MVEGDGSGDAIMDAASCRCDNDRGTCRPPARPLRMFERSVTLPFISVIIPTFNRLALLHETIASVRNQTFRDFEIIVVNDGSVDGTEAWLDTQDDIRAIHQANRGIAASRNSGAAAARGEWFAFLDHDDTWAPDKLKVQAEFVQENPEVALVATRHARMGKPFRKRAGSWVKGDLFVRVFAESFIHTSSVMIRRDVFNEIRGFPTVYRFADEFDVWLKIAAVYPIAYVDSVLTFIRFYDSNTSHNRVGVRTHTYQILQKNYDPGRIPRTFFSRPCQTTTSRLAARYLKEGNMDEALRWFRQSVKRSPWRLRGWRYLTRYGIRGMAAEGWPGGAERIVRRGTNETRRY